MLGVLEGMFGKSKEIERLLEHMLAHAPNDLMVSGKCYGLPGGKHTDEDVPSGLGSDQRGCTVGTKHMITMIEGL